MLPRSTTRCSAFRPHMPEDALREMIRAEVWAEVQIIASRPTADARNCCWGLRGTRIGEAGNPGRPCEGTGQSDLLAGDGPGSPRTPDRRPPALFDLWVIGQVVSVGSSYRRSVPQNGAEAGNSETRDRGDASGIAEKRDVGIPQHALDVPVKHLASGLSFDLSPSRHDGVVPGTCAASSGASRAIVTVSVHLATAACAALPTWVHTHTQTPTQSRQDLRICHARSR